MIKNFLNFKLAAKKFSFVPKELVNIFIFIRSYCRKYHSLNLIDKEISILLPHKTGFYLEIGANDGVSQSNTLYFERFKNWKGILVEPDDINFKLCMKNRKSNNKFFNCACVSFDYKDRNIDFVYSNLMSTTIHHKNDFQKKLNHAKSGSKHLFGKEKIIIKKVIARPLEDLLEEANAPLLIDFFSLDVEGNELEVLKGLTHVKYRFKYLVIETNEIEILNRYLSSKKYKLLKQIGFHDFLFENSA